VLEDAGVKEGAVEVLFTGLDRGVEARRSRPTSGACR
jgi:DMSO/TMAO reductase YedYZ molybdopterin-dependent catalytic subunit